MGIKDLYPSKDDWKELKNFTDPEYLKEKSLWWHLEQFLSLAFVVLAIFHASAIADYKMTIREEVKEKGCYELFQEGVDADLYNQSELPEGLQKENYESLTGRNGEAEEPETPENFPYLNVSD
jgi:hypothetical protein